MGQYYVTRTKQVHDHEDLMVNFEPGEYVRKRTPTSLLWLSGIVEHLN